MDRGTFIICIIFVFSLGIGGDCRRVEGQNSQNKNQCLTPNNLDGICIGIKTCPTLLSLLINQGRNSTIAAFLRNSHCGYEYNFPYYPKVCCQLEKESTTYTETSQGITDRKSADSPIILPYQSTCGQTNVSHAQIAGGNPAKLGAWPWMAALGFQCQDCSKFLWRCSGYLISDRYVLTAAQCTSSFEIYYLAVVRLGNLKLDSGVNDGAKPINVAISSIIKHDMYNEEEFSSYNIALLKLENIVSFNQFIQPICLPNLLNHRNSRFDKSKPFVAGWGNGVGKGSVMLDGPIINTTLVEAQVPVIDNSECQRVYQNSTYDNIVIDDSQMCAGRTEKTVCMGDYGGPLMLPIRNQYYLIGVMNFGPKNCNELGYPYIYTRVTSFVEWIADNMNFR